jgi:hypothetical protein
VHDEHLDAEENEDRCGACIVLDIPDGEEILSEFFVGYEVLRLVIVLGEVAHNSEALSVESRTSSRSFGIVDLAVEAV